MDLSRKIVCNRKGASIMEPLHEVTTEELPALLEWSAQHLPGAQKIYGTVKEELNGRWQGPKYFTLGWPKILAVGEGPVDASKCKCAGFFNDTRHTCVYSPNPEHVEELLRRPEFLDWTQPIFFHATDYENVNVVEKVSNSTGSQFSQRISTVLLAAYSGEIEPRPVPDGFELRQLDPDRDAEFVASTWAYRRNYTVPYLRETLKIFPSLGLFNKQGECVALEIMSEYGTAVLLYTREDYRGRGLASCVVSHLAQKFFEENRPIMATVLTQNKPAMNMHKKQGECVALEVMSEYGTAVLLYTREDYRGRGLASCVVSHLAQKFFEDNRPILATVSPLNKPSMDMHQKLGFRVIGKLCWFVHSMAPNKVLIAQ